ncbi:unknown [Clostridium sp. CAG:628]|nr:unknown [Clostridium sp. CAG:628]
MDFDTKGAKANPSYNCTDIRDAFSVDNTSAKLDYPISLMTADEIAFAGGDRHKRRIQRR